MSSGAKHAGSRKAPRAARAKRPHDRRLPLYAVGITSCLVSWGYLVWSAIDFGAAARQGSSAAWWFVLMACVGAACCLFAGLMIGVRLLTKLGIIAPPVDSPERESAPAPGRRIAR